MAVPTEQLNGNNQKAIKRISGRIGWFFTWNNYPEDARDQLLRMLPLCKELEFQSEVGALGTPHVQGFLRLHKPRRTEEFAPCAGIYWRPLASAEGARTYCEKEETYDGKFRFKYPAAFSNKLLGTLTEHVLKPWQKEVEDLFHTEPDKRTIWWYWDTKGNIGKSWFMKYMYIKYRDMVMPITCSKSADILTVANQDTRMYLFDFPRSNETFYPWNALEQLKNGMVTQGKLIKKLEIIVFPNPHVVCFANNPPDTSKMSADRWRVICLDPADIPNAEPKLEDNLVFADE